MAIEMKEAGPGIGVWGTEKIDDTDIWYDASGIGWDIEYVTRFETLRSALRGTLICVWDPEYDETRAIWTGSINIWPAVLAQCLEAADVQVCLAFALKYDLPISIRMEGHIIAEQSVSDGALVVDISLI